MTSTLKRIIVPLSACAASMALVSAPAIAQQNPSQRSGAQPDSAKSAAGAVTVSAEKLSDDPQNYLGKTVTVTQDVEDVIGPNVFTLDDGEFFGTSPDILVFAPNAIAAPSEDRAVTVTGTVRQFTYADLQRDYGWGWGMYPWVGPYAYGYPYYGGGAYGPDYWVRYNNRPVIIASSIKTENGAQLVSNKNQNQKQMGTRTTENQPGAQTAVGTSGSTGSNLITDVSRLSGRSALDLAGQRVQLKDVTVERVAGKRGFWTSGTQDQKVFVALDDNIRQPNLQQGEKVTIAGKVLKTPADASKFDKQKWGLSSDDVNQLMQDKVFVRADALRGASDTNQK